MKKQRIAALLLCIVMLCNLTCCDTAAPERAAEPAQTEAPAPTETAAATELPTETQEDVEDEALNEVELILPDGSFRETFTLMIYMTGSNLESDYGCATEDLEEILSSGVDLSSVNVLAYTGGCKDWHSNGIRSDVHSVLHLMQDGYEIVNTFPEQSMGEADSLTRFLNYACENYPADSYGLILWDHGNGPVMGYGSDLLNNGDSMKLVELDAALAASPFGSGKKLAFLGFDACLMASAELVCTAAPYAEYLVSSQETEPSFGWDYSFLEYCGQLPAADLAHNIVSSYLSYCTTCFEIRPLSSCDVTLSVIDLSCGEKLQKAIDALFEAAAADVSGDYRDLAVARIQSRALGRASTGSEYDLVDLYSLAEQMREQYPKQAKAILDILDEAVPTNGTNTVGCYGVNLFYPYYNKRYFEAIWRDDYTTLNAFPHYSNYLTRFSQIWLGTDMLDAFNDLSDPEAVTNSTFTLQLTGEQKECFASAGFYVLRRISDEQYAMVSYSRNVTEQDGLLTANFDGRAIYYTVGSDLPRMPTIVHNSSYDNIDEYLCMPFYSRGLSDGEKYAQQSTDLLLRFDTVTGEVTINGLYEKTDDDALASGKRREIDPSEWETVTFYDCSGFYLTRDSAGRIIDYFDWTKGEWITGNEYSAAQPISFSYEPIYDDGSEYFVMFRITDAQGGCCCSELMPIRLVERPPEEHSVTEREWTEGSSVLLEETDDCALYLRYLHFLDTDTDRICVVMENKSGDREMLLRVGDITADDSFLIENGGIEIRGVSPGETKYSVIDGLSAYCTLTGIELPSTLSFAVLAETPSMDVLVKDEYSVRICDAVTADSQWYPFLGARADTQILYQADDVKVTLEALGFQPSDKDSYYPSFSPPEVLHVLLKIENGSAGDLTFACFGLVANGMMIDLQSNSFKTKTIASDTTACVLYSKELSAFSSYEITSISDLVLYLCCAPAGSYHYDYRGSIACPVALTQKGAYVAPEHGGTLVYEDDTLQLYRKQINSADLSLCYVNKTDQPLVVRVVSQPLTDTEESRKLSDAFVPQNAMLCSKCSFFTSWAKGNSIPVVLEVRVGEREYRSAVFTLSISEEAAP